MESIDSGKPIRDCATIDLPETIDCLLWHAEAVDKIYDQTAPAGEDALAVIVREPDRCCWLRFAMELSIINVSLENSSCPGSW